jgi:hypothetical protein
MSPPPLKGTVQRDGSDLNLAHSIGRQLERRRVFFENSSRPPIYWEPFKVLERLLVFFANYATHCALGSNIFIPQFSIVKAPI